MNFYLYSTKSQTKASQSTLYNRRKRKERKEGRKTNFVCVHARVCVLTVELEFIQNMTQENKVNKTTMKCRLIPLESLCGHVLHVSSWKG